jgi:hypothetical protein
MAGALALGAGSMAGFSACSSGTSVGGELMLAISTDIVPGKDLDRIDVTVEHHGRVQLQKTLPLGGGKGLPATIPITALAGDTDPVTVRVIGYSGDTARIRRDVVTTVPDGRTALLYLPLQYLCDRVTSCPDGKTCIAGACSAQAIEVKTLPDYAYDKVFKGPCLDVAACFEGASPALPTASDCRLSEAQGGSDNYALRLPAGSAGTCGGAGCDVPLVQDSTLGWTGQQLPPAVCTLLGSGGARLVKSTKCSTMTLATPTCQEEPSDGGTEAGAPTIFVSSAPRQPIAFVVAGKSIVYVSDDNAVVELDPAAPEKQSVVYQTPQNTGLTWARTLIATDGVDVAWGGGGAWAMHGGKVVQLFAGSIGGAWTGGVVMDPRQPGVVYYLKDGQSTKPNELTRVNSDGTSEATTFAGKLGDSDPYAVVAADDTSVYWLGNKQLVAVSPPTASGTRRTLTSSMGTPYQVVGTDIYWATSLSLVTVNRLPTNGGASPTVVATFPVPPIPPPQRIYEEPCAFAVDATYVYYCSASGANVVRQLIAGGPAFSVAQLPGSATSGTFGAIRLAGGKLYAQVNDTDVKSSGFLIVTLPP